MCLLWRCWRYAACSAVGRHEWPFLGIRFRYAALPDEISRAFIPELFGAQNTVSHCQLTSRAEYADHPAGPCRGSQHLEVYNGKCQRKNPCGQKWGYCCAEDGETMTDSYTYTARSTETTPRCMNTGFGCINATCTKCGYAGGKACPPDYEHSAPFCMNHYLAIQSGGGREDGHCQMCGVTDGPPCTPESSLPPCNDPFSFVANNKCSNQCGWWGQTCCPSDGYECHNGAHTCQSGLCKPAPAY